MAGRADLAAEALSFVNDRFPAANLDDRMPGLGRVEPVDLKGTGRSGWAGDVATVMAADHRFADIHGVAGRLGQR